MSNYLSVPKIQEDEIKISVDQLEVELIFNLPEINTEEFYLSSSVEDLRVIFEFPEISEKINRTEMCLINPDLFLKILNIIPMDADILYYYKFMTSGFEIIPENCFLQKTDTKLSIQFLSFIQTHVKAEKNPEQVGKDTEYFSTEMTVYKKLMICNDPDSTEYNYCGSLAKILSYKLIGIINEDCKKYSDPTSLKALACSFKESFVPIPTTPEQLAIFSTLIDKPLSAGSNGAVFSSKINEIEVATKIPLRISERTLYEAVASLCIINEYIDRFPVLGNSYTYCYGLFSCPSFDINIPEERNLELNKLKREERDKEIKINKNQAIKAETLSKLCLDQHDPSNIYEVYKKIEGISLNQLLPNMTLEQFKIILKKLLLQLIPLQEGPYHFTHGDMHGENVMINNFDTPNPDVYLIDYGLSSYEIAGIKFFSFTEETFLKKLPKKNIVSGVYDLTMLLMSVDRIAPQDSPLQKYAAKLLVHILFTEFKGQNDNDLTGPEIYYEEIAHLYTSEYCLIKKGSKHNLNIMEKKTYLWIYKKIQSIPELSMDNTGNSDIVRVLQEFQLSDPPSCLPNIEIKPEDFRILPTYENARVKSLQLIIEKMKALGHEQDAAYVIDLYDKLSRCSTITWKASNIASITEACLYITALIFGINVNASDEGKQMSKLLLKELNYRVIPFG